ncbi:MAG TPA: hypothetical protein VF665_10345 [Longimicrobium sp.]|uniref:hypothetical protein n=1 Tax=Longimicrobium sp. TaxID=2029185 RepID=UPI002ED9DB57
MAANSAATLGGLVLAVLGALAAVFLSPSSQRTWNAFHFNWMFWSSVAIGMVMFAVALHLTNARWAWSIKRFPLGGVAFLPFAFLLFIPLMLGGKDVFFHHWLPHEINGVMHNPIEGDAVLEAKAGWLNFTFLFVRSLAGMAVLFGLAMWFAYHQLRADVHGLDKAGRRSFAHGWLRGSGTANVRQIAAESQHKALKIGVFTAVAYAIVWGFVGMDVAMLTLPHFYSTMFPVAFFISAFHSGLAMTAIMVVLYRGSLRLQSFITERQFHDLGKLIFAFAVFWMYINWSQYVVIWYGLLPHEQEYFILKFLKFGPLVIAAVLLIFVLPFFGLLPRSVKKVPQILAGFCVLILAGHWLERFLLATPNFWLAEWGTVGIGLPEIAMALAFLGLFVASYTWYMATFPILPSPVTLAAMPTGLVEVEVPNGHVGGVHGGPHGAGPHIAGA